AAALNGILVTEELPTGGQSADLTQLALGEPRDEEGGGEEGDGGEEGEEEEGGFDGVSQLEAGSSFLRRVLEPGLGLADLTDLLAQGPLALRDALLAVDADAVVTATHLDGVTPIGSGDTFAGGVVYSVNLTRELEGIADLNVLGNAVFSQFGLNDTLADALRFAGQMEISADVSLNLVFGIDTNGFFLKPAAGAEFLVHHIELAGDVRAEGRFGFVGVDLDDIHLTVDAGVGLRFDLKDPGTTGADGFIRVPELAAPVSDLVDFTLNHPGTKD